MNGSKRAVSNSPFSLHDEGKQKLSAQKIYIFWNNFQKCFKNYLLLTNLTTKTRIMSQVFLSIIMKLAYVFLYSMWMHLWIFLQFVNELRHLWVGRTFIWWWSLSRESCLMGRRERPEARYKETCWVYSDETTGKPNITARPVRG